MMSQPSRAKHAYLVLAHEDVAMLNILVTRLSKTGSVFVHLDAGCSINLREIVSLPEVQVFKEIRVKWGGWSIVQATRFLADKAIASGASRLTLLSGVTYPIVDDRKLEELAASDIDVFAAGLVDLANISKPFKRRFTSRHLEFKLGNSIIARIVRRLSREVFALLPSLNPNEDLSPLKLTLGSQWWSVTSKTYSHAFEILKINAKIEKYFKKIECSDESFFGTLFTAVSTNKQNTGTTYVEWGTKGRPISLDGIDPETSKDFFFARKFNSSEIELIEQLPH